MCSGAKALESLSLLAAQCGHAGLRDKHRKVIKKYIETTLLTNPPKGGLEQGGRGRKDMVSKCRPNPSPHTTH